MKYCTHCGNTIDNDCTVCPSCGSVNFLNVCGQCSNKFEGSYCPECGKRFNEDVVHTVKYKTRRGYHDISNEDKDRSRLFLSIICSLIGIFTAFFPLSIVGLFFSFYVSKKVEYKSALLITSKVVAIIAIVINVIVYGFFIFLTVYSNN